MRVLHTVKTAHGAAWALLQMEELRRLGVDVHVAVPPDGPMLRRYDDAGVTTHPVDVAFPTRRPWQWRRVSREFRALVDVVKPDIVHSHFVHTTVSARLALRGSNLPRVFQVPGPLHLEYRGLLRGELALSDKDDYWVASCRWTRERYLEAGLPSDHVFLSHYGTKVEIGRVNAGDSVRAELGLPSTAKIAGMVAYLYAPKRYLGQRRGIKGHEDFIDAVALCRKERPELVGVCVGGAWNGAHRYERRVRRYAERRCPGGIRFLGTRPDVLRLYKHFDVAVQASHSENCGGAVESLLSSTPTIATNVGGFPDVVVPGVTGWLVPTRDPAALAEAILEVLASAGKAKQFGIVGRERTVSLFDVRTTARQIAAMYEQILVVRTRARPSAVFA